MLTYLIKNIQFCDYNNFVLYKFTSDSKHYDNGILAIDTTKQ